MFLWAPRVHKQLPEVNKNHRIADLGANFLSAITEMMRGLWVNVWFAVCKLSLQLMEVNFSVTCSQVLEQTSLNSLQMVVVRRLSFECLHNDNPLNHLSVFAQIVHLGFLYTS